MTSEIRANTIKNRVGLGTVSFTNTGTVVSGIVTANTLRLPDSTSGSLGRVQLGNGSDLSLFHNGSNSFLINNTGYLSIQSQDGVNGIFIARNAEVNLYYGPSVRLQTSSSGVTINRDLDVDGHTNLDNVSIAGITTMGQTTIFTTGGTTLLLKDSDSSNPADRSGIAFVDQNNTQTAFIGKESASDAVLTINNTNTINPIRLKVNNTTRLEVGNAGVYATGSLSATGTLSAGGTLYIPDDIQHSGDADTKIRFPSNDNISIETAGTSRIRIDGNGNIGINCTPASSGTLYDTVDHFLVIGDNDTGIAQDGDGQFEIWANQQEIINFSTVGIDPKKSILPNQAINIGQTSFPISHIYSTNITVGSQLIHQGDTDTFLEFGTNTISFDTAGSERLRISSGGQFTFNHDAVGTAYNFNGPSADNNWGGYLKLHSNNGTTVRAEIRASTSGMMFGYGGSERLRINSNGSVQVTPEGSTSNPYMLIDTSGDSVRFNAKKASGNNEFRFLTQSSGTVAERLRIGPNGHVSIGKNSTSTTGPGLVVQKYSELANSRMNINDGNYFMAPAGRMCVSFGYPADGEDLWVGWQGAYTATSGSCGILFSPTHGNTGQQSGMYIRGEATASSVSHLSFGKVIGGSNVSTKASLEEYVRINANGHLSLGGSNVTDVNMITVNGSGQTQNIGIVFNKTNSPARAHGINVHNGSGDLIFYDYTVNAERLRIATTGKISIGTQNVTEGVLQVNGDITAKLRHGSSDMYGMLAGRKFDGTSALGGYAIRYASGYESPWIVGYNAGSGYNNQITFGSMTTSDRSLATGVQKRMVIDMHSGNVGISSASPVEKLDVAGSINAGGENAPVFKIHNEQGDRVFAFKHYFDVSKGASSGSANNRTLVAITMNENFHQAFFEVSYGTRLQAVSDTHTRPNKVIFGVNRFNGGSSINVTKTVIEQHSDASNYCDVNIVSISATVYHVRLEFASQPNVSSGAGGWVEGCNVLGSRFHDVNVYYGIRD